MSAKLKFAIFVIFCLPLGAPLAVFQLLDLASSTVDSILKIDFQLKETNPKLQHISQ